MNRFNIPLLFDKTLNENCPYCIRSTVLFHKCKIKQKSVIGDGNCIIICPYNKCIHHMLEKKNLIKEILR